MPDTSPEDRSADFLLTEFEALQQRSALYEEIKTNRINFFLIIVAAGIAVLPTIFDKYQPIAVYATASIAVLVLVLGLVSLNDIVIYSVSIAAFQRRAGRIRRWFVEKNYSVAPYVAHAPRDDRPRIVLTGSYAVFRGAERLLIAINSFAAATAVVALIVLAIGPESAVLFSLLGGPVGFFAAWYLQGLAVRHTLRTEERDAEQEVHFPYNGFVKRSYEQNSD